MRLLLRRRRSAGTDVFSDTTLLFRNHPAPGYAPYSPRMTREEELNYMKDQAEAIKGQLEEIESRMRDLEAEK